MYLSKKSFYLLKTTEPLQNSFINWFSEYLNTKLHLYTVCVILPYCEKFLFSMDKCNGVVLLFLLPGDIPISFAVFHFLWDSPVETSTSCGLPQGGFPLGRGGYMVRTNFEFPYLPKQFAGRGMVEVKLVLMVKWCCHGNKVTK